MDDPTKIPSMDDPTKEHNPFCSWNSKSHDSPRPPPPPQRNRRPARNNEEEEARCREVAEIISGGGDTQCLKIDHCRAYLRKHSLPRRGTKQEMIERIQEHLELKDNGGLTKYPGDTFVVECTGHVHVGDTILFRQTVFEKKASLPPLGERVVAGRVIKKSSTISKTYQKSTFTVEVLWSNGVSSLPPLYPLTVSDDEISHVHTYRQLQPSEAASIKAMKKRARAEANIRAMKAREVTGTSNGLHEQSNDKQGAALRTAKSEVEDEGKGKGEGSSIDQDKGKVVLVDLEDDNIMPVDDNIKSNAKEDNQQLTPSHNSSASQEPGIMETEMTQDEGNKEKQIQGELEKGKESALGQVQSNDMEYEHGFSRCKKRKYNIQEERKYKMQEEKLEENDGLFKNSDDGRDDSEMEVPEKEISSDISVDPPGGSSPRGAPEKYEQWRSITPSLNTKLGNHVHGEKSKNIYDGEVIPDLSGEVADNKVSAASEPRSYKGDKKKYSKRQVRQYLWLMKKRMKHPAVPKRHCSTNTTAKESHRRWPFRAKCYISDCPQKAARKCVNKLCRSCCVAVGGSCVRHNP